MDATNKRTTALLGSLLAVLATVSVASPSENLTTLQDTSITVKVNDFDAARTRVMRLGEQREARLMGSATRVNFQGKKHGWLRFEVSAEELSDLCNSLRTIGKLYSERSVVSDHTSEVADLERRVGYLRQHEQEMIEFLNRPRRMRGSDILYLQERTLSTRCEMGSAIQRQEDLRRSATKGRISVFLFEPEPKRVADIGNWCAAASLRARSSLLRILAKGVTAGAFIGYFSIFWLPAVLVLVFFVRLLRPTLRR